ncbi:MAG: hypothetical protein EP332_02090 [Bacteroidetes bacterium]|nr:MAG: hypothetical protein EP332_02090 [Bacteroidota bacterium]
MNLRPAFILFISIFFFACSVQTSRSTEKQEDLIVQKEDFVIAYFTKLTDELPKSYKIEHAEQGAFLMIQATDNHTYAWPLKKVKGGYKVKLVRQIHGSTCNKWDMNIFSFQGHQINGVKCGNHKVCGF